MKRFGLFIFLAILFAGVVVNQAYSQSIVRKIKSKAEDKAVQKLFGEDKNTQGNQGNQPSSDPYGNQPSTSSGRSGNTKGEGLENTAPDVKQNIKDAEAAFNAKKFSDARFAVRQAILGVELEIGQKIIKDLPEKVANMPYVKEEDNVTSTGIGFAGLMITRMYRSDDKEFVVTIGNDAVMLSGVNMYLTSGSYASTADKNHKTTTYKGNRALIEFDEGSGYKLDVPFGQSSIIIFQGVNFQNEKELMSAADEIDIDKIKKELGEQ